MLMHPDIFRILELWMITKVITLSMFLTFSKHMVEGLSLGVRCLEHDNPSYHIHEQIHSYIITHDNSVLFHK